MTEHWNPINVWNKYRYEENIDSANHENDDNDVSKYSGKTNYRPDKEQRSSSIDESLSRAQPQREPVQINPNDFGTHVINPDHTLVQTSGLKNGSEDMVSRVPPTLQDTNKSNKDAPPGYQVKSPLTHDKDIDFFGDSKVGTNYSRSTLDQDGLHRGSVTTLPAAGQRRGSALHHILNDKYQTHDDKYHDSKLQSRNDNLQSHDKSSSTVGNAVATAATVGAVSAAAATGVTHVLMGSPTKEKENKMPSSWPSSEDSDTNKETQKRDIQYDENQTCTQEKHGHKHGFCCQVKEPEICGQSPSFYCENQNKARKWSEGWSHSKPSEENHTFTKDLLATGVGASAAAPSVPYTRVQELSKDYYNDSDDSDRYTDSGIPSTWGDQILPLSQYTDSETYKSQNTQCYKGDEGITSIPQNIKRLSQQQDSSNQDHGYSKNQNRNLIDKFSSSAKSNKMADAAVIGGLGGIGLGHQVKHDEHIAPRGWLSNQEPDSTNEPNIGDPPPSQWSEVDQHLEPKKWTQKDKSLPTGTGQDTNHEQFVDRGLDKNLSNKNAVAGATDRILETRKEEIVTTQEQKAFGNTQQQAFGGNSAFGSSGHVLVNDIDTSNTSYDFHNDEAKEHESSHLGIMGAAAAAVGGLFGFASKEKNNDTDVHSRDIKPHQATSQYDQNNVAASKPLNNGNQDEINPIGGRYEEEPTNIRSTQDGQYKSLPEDAKPIGGGLYEEEPTNIRSTQDGQYKSLPEDAKPIGGGLYEKTPDNIEATRDGRYESVNYSPYESNQNDINKTTLNQNDDHNGLGKGALAGVAATVGGMLGLNHLNKENEVDQSKTYRKCKTNENTVYGETHDNTIYGETHDNTVYGETHDNTIYGETKDNNIYGETKDNHVYGDQDNFQDESISTYNDDKLISDDSGLGVNDYKNNDSHRSAKEAAEGATAGTAATLGGVMGLTHMNKNSNTDRSNVHGSAEETATDTGATLGGVMGLTHMNKNSNTDRSNVHESAEETATDTGATLGGVMGLTHMNKNSNTDRSNVHGSAEETATDTGATLGGVMGLTHSNKNFDTDRINVSNYNREDPKRKNVNEALDKAANIDNHDETTKRNFDEQDTEHKSGLKAAAASALGLDHKNKQSEKEHITTTQQNQPIPVERKKEVPSIPSENNQHSYDPHDRYHSMQGKYHGNNVHDKEIIGGTVAGSTIGGSLSLNQKNKHTSHGSPTDTQTNTNSGRRSSIVPGLPSDTADENHSSQSNDYKTNAKVPTPDIHQEHPVNMERRGSKGTTGRRRSSIIETIIGGRNKAKYSDNDSGYDRSSKYQDASFYSGRTKSLPSVEQRDQDVRGSRFNKDHTYGADVRGSRYNFIPGENDEHSRYGINDIGDAVAATGIAAVASGHNESNQTEYAKSIPHIYQHGEPVAPDSLPNQVNSSKNYDIENNQLENVATRNLNNGEPIPVEHLPSKVTNSRDYPIEKTKAERKVSLPHIYRHGKPVRPEDAPNHGNNYESYEIENFKSDRLRKNSKSDKGIISTVGGMLGLNHEKDRRKSHDKEKDTSYNSNQQENYSNDGKKKSHKGVIASTIGAAGATAAAVGGALSVNKHKKSDNIQVNQDSIALNNGKRSSVAQKFNTTENEAESNLAPTNTQLDQNTATDNSYQGTNTQQNQAPQMNQETVPDSSISNISVSSGQNNRGGLYGSEAGGIAAVGDMFGLNDAGTHSSKTNNSKNVGDISGANNVGQSIDNSHRVSSGQNSLGSQHNVGNQNLRNNSTGDAASGKQHKVRTEAAVSAAPHGNIYVSDRQYETAYANGEDITKLAKNKSGSNSGIGAVAGTAAAAGAAASAIGSKLGLNRKNQTQNSLDYNSSVKYQDHANYGRNDNNENKGDIASAAKTVGNKLGLNKSNELSQDRNDTIHRGQANPMSGNNNSLSVQEPKLTNENLNKNQLTTPPKDDQSISSTRATTGQIIPDLRKQEVKNRYNDNLQGGQNTIDEINNPKHRKNSITQGIKDKFNNAVRRMSSHGSNGRRLSAAELYKNQQQQAIDRQNATAFGTAAPAYQEKKISREAYAPPRKETVTSSSPANQHNEVIQENVHPTSNLQNISIPPTLGSQETYPTGNTLNNSQPTGARQEYVRAPGVYTSKPVDQSNFVKVTH